ncbi:AimR family lysis-lysogeny pheromone receptor [Bacillus sp. SCS-151]|uniref:AimR family lysis-lysogeny pheromone receptor n=1 Tax=Nanhaiella sioensis TaxID=3115293 RepID=UPI00397B23A1
MSNTLINGELTSGQILKELMLKHQITQVKMREIVGKDKQENDLIEEKWLNKYLNGKKVAKFYWVLACVRAFDTLAGTFHEKQIMLQFIKEIDEKPELIMSAMMYCDQYNYLEELQKLTNIALNYQNNPNLKRYGTLTHINYKRKIELEKSMKSWNDPRNAENNHEEQKNKLLELCNEAANYKIPDSDLVSTVYKRILVAYIYHDLHYFTESLKELVGVEALINSIEDSHYKSFSETKYYVLQQTINLRNCNLEEARKFSYKPLDVSINLKTRAYSYVTLGLTWAFIDAQKALEYFEKALDLYTQIGMDSAGLLVIKKIQFLKIHVSMGITIEEIEHEQNKAYWLIKNSRKEEALHILDQLDNKEGTRAQRLWLRGLATDDAKYHWMSLELYIKQGGDRFFGMLPKEALLELGQDKYPINALYYAEVKSLYV